jgi:xanthine dehydrogenase YagR molybdenum-binding subunit
MTDTLPSIIGAPLERVESRDKVTGAARYAYEELGEGAALYGWIVQSRIARGRIRRMDASAVRALPGVVAVITHENAPRLEEVDDAELLVLQSDRISYRGQPIGVVVARTIETAREAAGLLRAEYDEEDADGELTPEHPGLYAPEKVNPGYPTDSEIGYPDAGFATAATVVDATYATPAEFNNPMEPHATIATWSDDGLELVESTQGSSATQAQIAQLFALDPQRVHVRNEHVGGGFGSKGSPRPNVPLAVIASQATGRPVKLCFTRQMMFSLAGYRTPTFSHMRLGADAEGRLTAVEHAAFSQTSQLFEFAEQTAEATRHMYASPAIRTSHRVAALDVPTPRWMRAPGESPGMYALESAMDELSEATGIDPVELRILNDAQIDPDSGDPFSSRHLVECLRRGAEVFGWSGRNTRREGRFLVGSGVAASAYPAMASPSGARLVARPGGRFELGVNAADIGTGARTVMRQIAADALGVDPTVIDIRIGDSALPTAPVAGGSAGTASWGTAVLKACRTLLAQLAQGAPVPPEGLEVIVDTTEDLAAPPPVVKTAFGAQFVEARVDLDSGEIAVPRMVGVFAAGKIMNARTARSQFLGGMTMGISMALHEVGHMDPVLGDYANHDFGNYHIAANADVVDLTVEWIEEDDPYLPATGSKGIGEIGIVGAAAAVANAVYAATGIRVRNLPIQPDKLVGALPVR